MKRKSLSILLAALVLALVACAQPPAEGKDNYPTLPSFSENQTPLEQLLSAVSKTHNAGQCTIRYGTNRMSGETTDEESFSQALSDAQALDWDALHSDVPLFPDNPDFLEDFCTQPIRAIPSNTGTIRYQLTDLNWDDMASILYEQAPAQEFPDAVCTAVIDIDADGRFCHLEVTMETDSKTTTVFLSISFPESP